MSHHFAHLDGNDRVTDDEEKRSKAASSSSSLTSSLKRDSCQTYSAKVVHPIDQVSGLSIRAKRASDRNNTPAKAEIKETETHADEARAVSAGRQQGLVPRSAM